MPELRAAFRALHATPIVTGVAILSLAPGIGANTTIFSLINALMLRSLPVKSPQWLVQALVADKLPSWSNPLWEQILDWARPPSSRKSSSIRTTSRATIQRVHHLKAAPCPRLLFTTANGTIAFSAASDRCACRQAWARRPV